VKGDLTKEIPWLEHPSVYICSTWMVLKGDWALSVVILQTWGGGRAWMVMEWSGRLLRLGMALLRSATLRDSSKWGE
jgi:hypothetical protein